MIPPLRTKNSRIRKLLAHRRIQILATLHGKRAVHHNIVLQHAHVRLARRTGESAVLEAGAEVVGHRGVQAESFVDGVGKVGHVFQVGVGGGAGFADGGEDFVAEFGVDGRVVGEFVDAP